MSEYSIEENREKLGLGIYVYKNVMNDPDDFLKNIKQVFENGTAKWDSIEEINLANKNKPRSAKRDLETFTIPYRLAKFLLDTHNMPMQAFNNIVGNKLYSILDKIEKDYCQNLHPMPMPPVHEPYYILKYGENNFFDDHGDTTFSHPRAVSLIFYLNSDYEGGEIEFPELDLIYKPKGNDVLVFPSNFIYHHKVHSITSGTRYAIVTWLLNSEIIED
jgi:hypothetical protein